jgi:hypothetical protein
MADRSADRLLQQQAQAEASGKSESEIVREALAAELKKYGKN